MIIKQDCVNVKLASVDQIVVQFIFSAKITAQIEAFATFKQEYVLVIQVIWAMIVHKYIFNA